jgi:SRSO17 transposase
MDAWHQQLLHVVGQARWEDGPVREYAAKYALKAAGVQNRCDSWVIDDTGFPKQGKHSVGVQRQYSGTLGKIGNCQIGVSLVATYPNGQIPVDFALYLPESWAEDELRRKRAKVPSSVQFQTKPELAVEMMRRALASRVSPPSIVLADAAYGNNSAFRQALRSMHLRMGVAIQASTNMWRADRSGKKARSADVCREHRREGPLPTRHLGLGNQGTSHFKIRVPTGCRGTRREHRPRRRNVARRRAPG